MTLVYKPYSVEKIVPHAHRKKINDDNKQLGLSSFFPSLPDKPEPIIPKLEIKRLTYHSDIWICNHCVWIGDYWFMLKHPCKNNIKNNFIKSKKQYEDEQSYKETRRVFLK